MLLYHRSRLLIIIPFLTLNNDYGLFLNELISLSLAGGSYVVKKLLKHATTIPLFVQADLAVLHKTSVLALNPLPGLLSILYVESVKIKPI